MKLPRYVISKGSLLHHIPLIGKSTAQSLGSIILVPDQIYRDLQTDNPHPKNIALLIHEETHRKRQNEMGFWTFSYKYVFNSTFRFQEELLAIKESMKYLKKQHIAYDFRKNAKFLASYIYLWPVSKEYAEKELKKAWAEI